MQENRFQLAGYLAAKPTLRYLPSSMPVANARLGQTYRLRAKRILLSTPIGSAWSSTGIWRSLRPNLRKAQTFTSMEPSTNGPSSGRTNTRAMSMKSQCRNSS